MWPPPVTMGARVPCMLLAALAVTCLPLPVTSSHTFTPEEPGTLEKMTLAVASGDVYLGAGNKVLRLSRDLVRITEASIGPMPDHPHCWMNITCKHNRTLTSQNIKVLLLNNQDQTLLVCGSLYKGSCLKLSSKNLTNLTWIYQPLVRSNTDPLYKPTVALLNKENQLFIGTSVDTESQDFKYSFAPIPLISTRNYTSPELSTSQPDPSASKLNLSAGVFLKAIYRYGFRYNRYFYSVSNQLAEGQEKFSSFIGRVCESDAHYRSYVEAALYCDSKGERYDVLTSAHFGRAGKTLSQTLGLNVDEPLLYGVFTAEIDSGPEVASSAVCIYRITDIDNALIRAVRRCFGGLGNTGPAHLQKPEACTTLNMKIAENYCGEYDFNFPIRSSEGVSPVVRSTIEETFVTAVHSTTLDIYTLLVMGTARGTILKATVESHSTVQVYDSIDVDRGSAVLPDLLVTDGGMIYAMTRRKVVRFDTSCDHHVTCEKCMTSADPHCGWCFRANRCLSEALCGNEPENWGWSRTRSGSCPAIVQTRPDQVPTGSSIELELWLSQLPNFPADLKCVIGGDAGHPGIRVPAKLVDGTKRFTCHGQGVWPQLAEDEDSKLVPVYLEVNRVRWLSTNVTLFDCQRHKSCTTCTTSDQLCAWCVLSQRCTDAARVSRLEQCGKEEFIYSNNASASAEFPHQGAEFCPRFDVIKNREPLLHSGVSKDIQLSARNIPQTLRLKIYCLFGKEEFSGIIQEEGDERVITCENVKLSYKEDTPFYNETIQVLLGETKTPIDNPQNSTIMLYKCEHMAVSCGQCLNLDPRYGCGQCEVYCSYKDACPTTWLDKDNICPNPQITRVQPVAGPLGGGTRLTIHGVDLGQEEGHIKNGVKVTGQPCHVVSYTPTASIECYTSASNRSVEGDITVTVNGSETEVYTAKARSTFTYVNPVLSSIFPELGPRSGGSKVTISGYRLDVGSHIVIDVEQGEDGGAKSRRRRRRRQSGVSNSSTPIIRRDSRSIVFESPRAEREGNMTFVIVVDGNAFTGEELTFRYVADPVITAVHGINTLPSGGAELRVIGERIDVIQDPELVVYVTNKTFTSPCSFKANFTDLFCLTPDLTEAGLDPRGATLTYGFLMDDVSELIRASQVNANLEPLRVHPTPALDPLPDNLRYTESEPVEFHGSDLNVLPLFPDSRVTVGGTACNITVIQPDRVTCYLPTTPTLLNDGMAQVVLTVLNHQMSPGSIIIHNVGLSLIKLILIIVAIALPILIIIIIIAVCLRRQNKKEKQKFQQQSSVPGIEDPAPVPLTEIRAKELDPLTVSAPDGVKRDVGETTPLTMEEEPDGGDGLGHHEADDDFGPYIQPLGDDEEFMKRVLDQVRDPRLQQTIVETLIPRHLVKLGDIIGKGHFGCVYSGTLASEYNPEDKTKVAVKTLQGQYCEPEMIESFLKEGVMMKNFDHPHVLELLGVSLGQQPLVILPYMAQGDLRTFVKNKQKNFTARQLLHLAQQVAQGMAYLASRNFVHRDLAARNCMIDEDDLVKVADFGLSKDLYEKDYYSSKDRKRKLPIKWMALESLEDYLFTTKSDVWSFGVLMWELITRGVTPYPDVDAFEMRNYLASGRRLRQPKFCPDNAYILMAECWLTKPEDRPTFADLVNRLELIVNPPRRINSLSSDEPLYMNIQRQPSLPNEIEEER